MYQYYQASESPFMNQKYRAFPHQFPVCLLYLDLEKVRKSAQYAQLKVNTFHDIFRTGYPTAFKLSTVKLH